MLPNRTGNEGPVVAKVGVFGVVLLLDVFIVPFLMVWVQVLLLVLIRAVVEVVPVELRALLVCHV